MKHEGHSTAAMDVIYGNPLPGKQDAMDLLSDPGFSLLECARVKVNMNMNKHLPVFTVKKDCFLGFPDKTF